MTFQVLQNLASYFLVSWPSKFHGSCDFFNLESLYSFSKQVSKSSFKSAIKGMSFMKTWIFVGRTDLLLLLNSSLYFLWLYVNVCTQRIIILIVHNYQRRQWQPTPVLLPGKSHGPRSLVGCSPWGRKESDTIEWLHFHFSLSCIGEGNGNPLPSAVYGVGHDWSDLAAAVVAVSLSL